MTIAVAMWVVTRARGRAGQAEDPIPTPNDLRVALGQAGVDAVVEERIITGGAVVGWVVTVTLAAPLAAFFTAVGSEAGKDAYAVFRTWFRRQKLRTFDSGAVILQGSDEREAVVGLGVPEEALEALGELDWSLMPSGPIVWDRRTRRWRTEPR